ncbi:hypothetical protein [Ferrimonas marina]|uniref:Uncharacterized protein n=1 Tax=Ferrimonas marina TaxID=299255 RepID=A0A1M5Z5H2_9GAMM|nr:hypothetical protein [Ferrimonas marina]SHI19431.1 hypothetical protein SAMN02745129_4677 [Ferrimonas marina]
MNTPRGIFELVVALTVLILGSALALAGLASWGLATTGGLLLTATLVLRPQWGTQALEKR